MRIRQAVSAQVDEQGRVIIPAELAAQFGVQPGANLNIHIEKNKLAVFRPVSHLAKVYIEPTSRCNLTCRTCIRNIWNEATGLMSEATFSRTLEGLRQVDPLPTVFFGGFGEPLSHPRILSMIAQVKGLGARVEMITNGTLLSHEISRRLNDLGIDLLWVSLDGVTPESYDSIRPGAELPEVMQNLAYFAQLRPVHKYFFPTPEIGVVFVGMKKNFSDLYPLVKLSSQLGAAYYMVTNVLPYTEDMRQEILYQGAMNEITFRASPMGPHITLPRLDRNGITGPALDRLEHTGYLMSVNDDPVAATGERCPFINAGATAIAWDGYLSPCLPLVHNHLSYLNQTHRTLRRHVIGNVKDHNLLDLWNDPEYTAFRQRVQLFDFPPCTACGGCQMLEENQEDCYGNAFPTCGGCLWAQGIIQCP